MKIAIILAAGEGTRMKSNLPKVMHKVGGFSLVDHVINSCSDKVDKIILVLGHKKEIVKEHFKNSNITIVEQPIGGENPYGTGFAVLCAKDEFKDEDSVLILNGDTPLIEAKTIEDFLTYHKKNNFDCSVLSAHLENPKGYGRIIRHGDQVLKIVEEKDADDSEKQIKEINSGIFAFKGGLLKEYLGKLNTNNAQGELYLTDVLGNLKKDNKNVGAYTIYDEIQILGVNSRRQLCELQKILNEKIINFHLDNGVTFIDPKSSYVEKNVKISKDTIIFPGVYLEGNTVIGENVIIRGNARIVDSTIGDNVEIESSLIESSIVSNGVKIGPFSHLRPNSNIGDNCKIGNFVEIKNSSLGKGTKASHLAYVGDADVGKNVNIGCGAIFVNYDGKNKFRTIVGDNAFIGSNSNLVAPLVVEDYGYVAAGSTITKKVSKGELALERSKQLSFKDWVEKKGLLGGKE